MAKKKDTDNSNYQVGKALPINSSKSSKKFVKNKHRKSKKKITLVVSLIILVVVAILGFVAWNKINNIFKGSFFDIISKSQPLEKDKFGRSNIVIFGTSEDDPKHSGAKLADSILVISINQDTKDANMLSIPRDLWVKLNNKCSLGTEQKINASYPCALEANNGDEREASEDFAKQVSEVIGTDIQYYAKVNYTVVRNVVDSLGGIEVDIQSNDPRGIYDPATKIQLPNGKSEVDGATALELARSRDSSNRGYGLSKSNFDRERNQQAVVRGILSKSTSSGTLANPAKVLSVFGSLGDNIISNIETKNVKTIVKIASEVSDDKVVSLKLDDKEAPLVTTGMYRGVSIVRPKIGMFDYSEIHAYIEQAFSVKTEEQN